MAIQEACSEVNYILTYLDPEDKKKIPESVIEFFNENKDIFYKVQIDKDKPLKDQPLQEETKALLHLLHYYYLATEEEKKEFKKYIQESDGTADIESIEENINPASNGISNSEENTELVVYNDSFYKKVSSKIKSIFSSIFGIFKKNK